MSQPFLGEIEYFAFGFAPKGWAQCSGQLMSVNQNQALFSLLGTTYGGDGIMTFGLPDLRSRIAVGQGTGAGLSTYVLGEAGGQETVTIQTAQMPAHTHQVGVVSNPASTPVASPNGNLLSVATDSGNVNIYAGGNATGVMSAATIGNGGASQPHENRMPYLALTACIALNGSFPSRS